MESIGIPWRKRVEETANRIIPFLVENAPAVIKETEDRLNAPLLARRLAYEKWLDDIAINPDHVKSVAMLRRLLDLSARLIGDIESQQVSRQLQYVLTDAGLFDKLGIARSSGSLYPDLYFKDYDYSKLPLHSRAKKIEGPNLRKGGTPSNVPDGCELKTNQSTRVKVDAHAPHPGLHLALTWDFVEGQRLEINGFRIAYIRKCDYTHGERNVEATTVKYSFGHVYFFSLLV